jgi:lipid II:glycine glycyltransferase (peptidoglycan interpeptide bridge formation enzyme)
MCWEVAMAGKGISKLEIERISNEQWADTLQLFLDATFFQTREYGGFAWGEENLEQAVLKVGDRTVAAAQVRTWSRVPGLKYAHVTYGPMWKTKETPGDRENLDLMVTGLVEEYVKKRGYSLRVFPFIHDGDAYAEEIRKKFLSNGFTCSKKKDKTLYLDVSMSLDELRKNLRRKWRQSLNHAEGAGLDIIFGEGQELFAESLRVYREMHNRKGFTENVKMDDFLALNETLPEAYKFKIVAIRENEIIHACLIWSAVGDTAIPVLAATATSGLKNNASYLAYWEMIRSLHEEGTHWLDLRGIDQQSNPGGYTFKTGVTGKKGLEVSYLGDFILHHGPFGRLLMTAASKARTFSEFSKSILK